MTYLQLITSSLRAIGQLGPGRSAGASELTDALFVLNSMLSAWSAERMNVYSITRTEFTLQAGESAHVIGDVSSRPVRIERAALLNGTREAQLDLLTYEKWSAGRDGLYYDTTYPNGALHIRPTPDGTKSLVLYTWAKLTAVASTGDTVEFPEGYADAIRYNLAIRLGVEWGKPANAQVVELAAESLGRIQSLNAPVLEMSCDPALVGRGGFDVLTGDYL